MPVQRKTTSKTSTDPQSVAINFTKAIQDITKAQETFGKNVETLNDVINNTFSEIELKLGAKQKELNDLEEKLANEERKRKLELDLSLKEYGYKSALEIISERGEVAVPSVSYNELQKMYDDLKQCKDNDVKRAVKNEQDRNSEHIKILTQTLELKNQAEVAKVQAQLETQVNQIQLLEKTIERITNDLDEQRKLTKDVALASSKQVPMYIPQNNQRS